MDALSELLRSTLRFAGAHHPLAILSGLAGGMVFDGFLEVAAAGAPDGSFLRALAELSAAYSMALGVFIAVVVILLGKSRLDEETVRALNLIERVMERGELSQLDRRLAWRNVLAKAVQRIEPGGRKFDVQQIAEDAAQETRE